MAPSRHASVFFLVFVLSGCSWVPRPISEYKIDVQQGNVLTQDMVRKILKNPHYKTADICLLDHGLFRWDNDRFAPADAENSALYQKSGEVR